MRGKKVNSNNISHRRFHCDDQISSIYAYGKVIFKKTPEQILENEIRDGEILLHLSDA